MTAGVTAASSRGIRIPFRVTGDEKHEIDAAAQEQELTVSEFVRQACFEKIERDHPGHQEPAF